MMVDIERDLWREARLRNRQQSIGDRLFNLQQAVKNISFPGQPVKQVLTALPSRDKMVYMPDFNKYDTNPQLAPYVDAGCKAALIRMGGPVRWVQNNWGYEIDRYFKPLLEQADKLNFLHRTIGYIVHNPFELATPNGATGETLHTELIDDWTSGGYMPAAFNYDHEIDKCWNSVGGEVLATDSNLKDNLAANTWNTQSKFKRRVSAYTAGWFLRKTNNRWLFHDSYFYQINRSEAEGGAGVQRPLILAWYPQTFAQVFTNMAELNNLLITPSQEQIARFLFCGINASAWQFSDSIKVGNQGPVDMSISMVDEATFCQHFGLAVDPVTPPIEPPIEPPVEVGDFVTRAEFNQFKAAYAAHTHPSNPPQL